MFNLSEKDYRIAEHVRAEMRRQADEARLAQDNTETGMNSRPVARHRRLVKGLAVTLALMIIFTAVGQVFADGPQPIRADAGGPPEPYAEAMRAYREGLYALKHNDPDLAVEKLAAAVESIPAGVIAVVPAYQDMYWVLGEAQEAAGSPEDALISFQHWLALAGDGAAAWTVLKVQKLEAQSDAVLVADTRL